MVSSSWPGKWPGRTWRWSPPGGLDLPDRPLGTDAALIARAIEAAWADDGVLVLMDLGSAVLSAEMAAEMMPDERRSRLVLCEAPLVEGAVAAAVAARLGDPLDKVAAEARGGLAGKVAHLARGPAGEPAWPARPGRGAGRTAPALELRITVTPAGSACTLARRPGSCRPSASSTPP